MPVPSTIKFHREMPPFIVAEIGNNHEGDFGRAKELLHAAAECGVDAVKFQTITPAKLVTADQVDRIAQLNRFSLDSDQFAQLSKLAERYGVAFFSTPFDLEAVDQLDPIQSLFKISSGDNTFNDLVRKVGSKGKPTLISTGGMSQESIQRLHQVFSEAAVDDTAKLVLLHCISLYPTRPEDAQLWRIKWLYENFSELTIGYSDHTLGVEACKMAVAMGARVLEKHFTLDKNQSEFRDHQLSADPLEMSQLVSECHDVVTYIGANSVERPDGDMSGVRRVAVAAKDIAAGKNISSEDISWLRSVDPNALKEADAVVGRYTAVTVVQGQVLKAEHLKEG
jgi:N,N'-diacetyllegionaminate synthase